MEKDESKDKDDVSGPEKPRESAGIYEELILEKEKAERYLNIADVMLLVIDADQQVSMINNKGCQILGYDEEEIIGKNWFDNFLPERYRDEVKVVFDDFIAGKIENIGQYENPVVNKNGEERLISWRNTILRDPSGRITGTLSSGEDITERKQAEDVIVKTNRALTVLSQCNKALVRYNDEQKFLDEVCRIIVEEGGYRLAWVGFAEDDDEKTVRPVAQWGYEAGYLEKIRVSWADDKYGRGPTGTAIRTGFSYVIRDTQADPHSSLWQREAKERGYASLLGLPLRDENSVFGALTIYAEEKDAFTAEEVELLGELASDLSYGVTSIRAKVQAEDVLERQDLIIRILQVLNETNDSNLIIENLLSLIKEYAQVEAVGLRLKRGNDYPYVSSNGFPEAHLEAESSLCGYDKHGNLITDATGNPALECMCGNIIQGRFDSSKPFFTEGGSFWANDTTELLKTTTEEDRQAKTRNVCNSEGYESVALIPIRSEEETIGLLQLNDSRKGMFSLDLIEFFESVAASLGITFARTLAQDALIESEKNYRSLIDNAGIGIVVLQEGKQVVFNSKLCEILGYSADEYARADFISVIHPEDRDLMVGIMQNRLMGEPVADDLVEIRVVTKSGETRWVEVRAVLIEWNKQPAVQIFIIDITEKKQLEELYTTITSSSPIGLYIYQDGKFCFVNPQFQKLTEYSAEELLGMAPYEIVHPDERQRIRQEAIQMLKGKHDNPYVFKVLTREGGTRWAMETVKSITYEGKRATLGSFMDVTENMLAEEALRQSEEKLRIIIESIPQGIAVTDLDGAIMQVNKAALAMFGYDSEDDILKRNAFDFAIESDRDRLVAEVTKAREENRQATSEFTAVRKNGDTFSAEMSIGIIKDASGEASGFIGVFEDITERKKMQEQLVVTDRLASVGELAAGIAHELNNPLTGVVGFSDLLISRNDIPEEIKDDLNTINKEALRASQVARHLLTFARKHPDEKVPTDINEVIQIVLDLRAYEQRVNNITVLKNLSRDNLRVKANDFQLQQVFLNIVINAEHFMIQEHGKGILVITTEKQNDLVRLTFEDDGPGISPDNLPHIFDPFFTTKEIGKGTGLGLSICYGIITEHGGKLYAESEPGKGAKFVIELPAYKKS